MFRDYSVNFQVATRSNRVKVGDYGVMTNFQVEGVVYGCQVEGK